MSASYKELVSRSKHGSKDAKLELTSRASQYIDTTLKGISDESIVFRKSSDILESVRYISSEIGNIKNDKSYTDIIILDAYSSATIEGARTTVENVKRCVSNPYTKDDKMVVNTMTAQKFVYDNGISASNIRHIWEVLVNDVCENYRLRGTLYRSGMVYVGNSFRVIHIPEKAENIKFRMNSLFKFCDTWKDSIIKACIVHFYFVYIHPFCDGNGRMARIWMNKILSNIDSNFRGLVISSEINKHLNEYYYSLSESEYSYNKIIDITTFIEYVLRLIANAVDYMSVKRYVKLSDTDRLILNKLNRDGMTVSKISKVLGMEKSKARYSVNKLVDNKMICVDKSGKEYRYYRLE